MVPLPFFDGATAQQWFSEAFGQKFGRESDNAAVVQSAFRGHRDRKALAVRRKAATKVTAVGKGAITRLGMRSAKAQQASQERAATRLQAVERGAAHRRHSKQEARVPVDVAGAFKRIDANGDGVLSRAEVIKACRADANIRVLLGLPRHIRQEDGSRDAFEAVFQRFDANDSKSINLAEFESVFTELQREALGFAPAAAPGPASLEPLFSGRSRAAVEGFFAKAQSALSHTLELPSQVGGIWNQALFGRRTEPQAPPPRLAATPTAAPETATTPTPRTVSPPPPPPPAEVVVKSPTPPPTHQPPQSPPRSPPESPLRLVSSLPPPATVSSAAAVAAAVEDLSTVVISAAARIESTSEDDFLSRLALVEAKHGLLQARPTRQPPAHSSTDYAIDLRAAPLAETDDDDSTWRRPARRLTPRGSGSPVGGQRMAPRPKSAPKSGGRRTSWPRNLESSSGQLRELRQSVLGLKEDDVHEVWRAPADLRYNGALHVQLPYSAPSSHVASPLTDWAPQWGASTVEYGMGGGERFSWSGGALLADAAQRLYQQALFEARTFEQNSAAGRPSTYEPDYVRGVAVHESAKLILSTVSERLRLHSRRLKRRELLREAVGLLVHMAPTGAKMMLRGHVRVIGNITEMLALHVWSGPPPESAMQAAEAAAIATLLDAPASEMPTPPAPAAEALYTPMPDGLYSTRYSTAPSTERAVPLPQPPPAEPLGLMENVSFPFASSAFSPQHPTGTDPAGHTSVQLARSFTPTIEAQVRAELEQATAMDATHLMLHAAYKRGTALASQPLGLDVSAAGAPPSRVVNAPSAAGVTGDSGSGDASGVGSIFGAAIRGATHAMERVLDDVSLAVSESVPTFAIGKSPQRVSEPLRVVVRLRPEKPPLGRRSERIGCAHGAVRIRGAVRDASPAVFQMDALLEEGASQGVAYAHGVGTLIPRLLAGRRCACIFLGQSGAGKTHAAFGTPALLTNSFSFQSSDEEWGAAPRASRQLFEMLGEAIGAAGPLELSLTWYEVNGEHIRDLLVTDGTGASVVGSLAGGAVSSGVEPRGGDAAKRRAKASSAARDVRIRESPAHGPYVKGLRRVAVERHDQVLALLAAGHRRRVVSPAQSNLHSSCATSFFSMHLRSRATPQRDVPLPNEPSLTLIDVAAPPAGRGGGGAVVGSSRSIATGDANARRGSGGMMSRRSSGGNSLRSVKSGSPNGQNDRPKPRGLMGPTHAALTECVELLHGAQARDEPASSLAQTFRRHPVTRLLQPYLLGECTTSAFVSCSVAESELPSTLAALRLGVLLRSITTLVPPSVPPLLPQAIPSLPPTITAIQPAAPAAPAAPTGLRSRSAPPKRAPAPAHPPPPELDVPDSFANHPYLGVNHRAQRHFAPDSSADTAQIRAIREHALALQRHLDATADRAASGGAARMAATPSNDRQGFGAHDSWEALYSLGGGGEAYQTTETNVRDMDRPADFRGYYVDSMASFM